MSVYSSTSARTSGCFSASADKTYRHSPKKYPNWDRISCLEGTTYVTIGKEYYMVTTDGYLMPTTKGQLPPDPRFFPQAQK